MVAHQKHVIHAASDIQGAARASLQGIGFDMDCLLPFLVVGSSSSALSPGLERWMSMGLSKLNIECVRCPFSFWAASSEQRSFNEMEHLRVSASTAAHVVHVASC